MANAGDTFTVELNRSQLEWEPLDLRAVVVSAMEKVI